jgi:prevent-host-death family protein
MSMTTKRMGAGAFKQGCLAVLDEVAQGKIEIVVTKRGRPVARLVPIASDLEREREILAGLRGRGRFLVSEAELLSPSSEDASWSVLKQHKG